MAQPGDRFALADVTPRSSKMTTNIAGFHLYLYGVDELTAAQAADCTVVFHIHGRTRTYADAEPVAHHLLHELRQRGGTTRGLVVATMDNRNHGNRAIDTVAIEDWKGGNQRHAQDMLSTMDGITADIQTAMTFLESYVDGIFVPTQFVITGTSLGGHVAWDVLARDPRVEAAAIVVGCPCLAPMLVERLDQYLASRPLAKATAAATGTLATSVITIDKLPHKEWPASVARLYTARDEAVARIRGKRILILNGARDTLVPSRFTTPWLEHAGAHNDVVVVEQADAGHALTVHMMDTLVDWLPALLGGLASAEAVPPA